MTRDSAWTVALCRLYELSLYLYPREFRARFGAEMRQMFRDRCQAVIAMRQPAPILFFIVATVKDWFLSSAKERIASMSLTIPSGWLRRTAKGLGVTAVVVLAYLILTARVVQAFVISAPSMEGSLRVGDHILVNKLSPGREISRGDLVTFRYPEDRRQTFVKRVIGLPGDRIRLMDKQVIRNGRRLVEPYAQHLVSSPDAYRDNFPAGTPPVGAQTSRGALDMLTHHLAGGEITVPAGSLFVLGDNRDLSLDSRYWGFVPLENVVGQPLLVYWSYDPSTSKTRWSRTLHLLGSVPPAEVQP